jgi:SAM-dependent methyltransferase
MTTTRFDPVEFKRAQRVTWNAVSAGWTSCHEDFESGGRVVTRRLLELGGVRPGQAVLDVGSGTGEPALSAAGVVGRTGHVVGLDLAPDMVAIARQRADRSVNVEFVTRDVESAELPPSAFDVVLSRWGLMFAVDHVAVFRALARTLVPGGVLAAAVWGPPAEAPMVSLAFRVLSARLDLPPGPPGLPNPFSMADPGMLTAELVAAGFTGVEVTPFDVPFVLESPERFAEYSKVVTPPGIRGLVRDRFGSEDDPRMWAAVAGAAEAFRAPDGRILLTSKALLVRAVAPAG